MPFALIKECSEYPGRQLLGEKTDNRWAGLQDTLNRLVIAKTCSWSPLTISREDLMPTFMMSLNWSVQGIRAVKDSPKRSEDARELAKKVGVEIKHLYLTSGDCDLVIFVDAPSGDNVAKFALAVSSLGNVRTALFAHGQQMNIGSSFPS